MSFDTSLIVQISNVHFARELFPDTGVVRLVFGS